MSYRPKDTQERILHRLKIAKGQLEKVIQMVEKDEYCIDVIHQSQAVQAAMKNSDALILKNHLESCVVNDIREGKINETVGEVMKVFEKSK